MLSQNKMQYVGDAQIATMYMENLPVNISDILRNAPDALISEQYTDFVTLRKNRYSIVCNLNMNIDKAVTIDALENLYYRTRLHTNDNKRFNVLGTNETIDTSMSPLLEVLLNNLVEKQTQLNISELYSIVSSRLGKEISEIKEEVGNSILRLLLSGVIILWSEKRNYNNKLADHPKLTKLARVQAEDSNWISNVFHETLSLNILDKYIVSLMDGYHDKNTIIVKMVEFIQNNKIMPSLSNEQLVDEVNKYYDNTLNRFAIVGLLES
jgi:methyltransferase-like protein